MSTRPALLPCNARFMNSENLQSFTLEADGAAIQNKQNSSVFRKVLVFMSLMKCQERCGPLSIGLITSVIRTAIQSITSAETRLEAVYGFGSAFRGEPFRDIDILAVVKAEPTVALDAFYGLRTALENATGIYGAPVHLTMLTEVEFASRPLRCMNALTPLWT
jgi:predicted nucleotidyltransferase